MHLAKEYQKNDVMTSDGIGVIILLYDGVGNTVRPRIVGKEID